MFTSVFPVPQRLLDPSDIAYRPGLGDFLPGGRYLRLPDLTDITGLTMTEAVIDVNEGAETFTVATQAVAPPSKADGPLVRINLIKRGWRWSEGHRDLTTLISVETGGKHFYGLRVEMRDGIILASYPQNSSEPRLRPTTRGVLVLGNVIGHMCRCGYENPVYDEIGVISKNSRQR